VEIWGASGEPTCLEQGTALEGSAEFPGLSLNLQEIWQG
jgi:Uma2 family endonuclease